jgi:hypothetical protein
VTRCRLCWVLFIESHQTPSTVPCRLRENNRILLVVLVDHPKEECDIRFGLLFGRLIVHVVVVRLKHRVQLFLSCVNPVVDFRQTLLQPLDLQLQLDLLLLVEFVQIVLHSVITFRDHVVDTSVLRNRKAVLLMRCYEHKNMS